MEKNAIEKRLQEILLPVFGLTSTDEIPIEASLVNDIGADSLDFVEIVYLIEQTFSVVIKPGELAGGGTEQNTDDFFAEGRLTASGAQAIKDHFADGSDRIKEGMTKIELFRSISVADLAEIIQRRIVS
ncbi:MAG: phosphopantetheine-binding protein [Treponema sp.]|nr:phosphopantetheine-binding protein [Treponema sp.]